VVCATEAINSIDPLTQCQLTVTEGRYKKKICMHIHSLRVRKTHTHTHTHTGIREHSVASTFTHTHTHRYPVALNCTHSLSVSLSLSLSHTQVSGSTQLQARIQLVDADGQEIKRPICPYLVCTYEKINKLNYIYVYIIIYIYSIYRNSICPYRVCMYVCVRARACTCAFVKLILIKVLLIIFCGQSALGVHNVCVDG